MNLVEGEAGIPTVPLEIASGCPQLDLVWRRYARDILDRPGVLIPDNDDDLNWHAFLGHSIDQQGFRAAEFAGVDPLTTKAPDFVPLLERGVGVAELASLWQVETIQHHLLTGTAGKPLATTLEVLRSNGGRVGSSLADAFQSFPYRKGHWCVRAFLQNSAALAADGFSFRTWLRRECALLGSDRFPPGDFRKIARGQRQTTLEDALRLRLEAAFYRVGPAMAPYMICDWQLWLWAHGRTTVFANFKWDAFQDRFVNQYGKGIIPNDEKGFTGWWLERYPKLPPRLANECIWLGVEHGDV
jgi:hypothetical protein